jgi:hypothetical protein
LKETHLDVEIFDTLDREACRKAKKKLFEAYLKNYCPDDQVGFLPNSPVKPKGKTLNFYKCLVPEKSLSNSKSPKNELQVYLDMPSEPLETDVLTWWKLHSRMFPNLSNLARDILSIPGRPKSTSNLVSHPLAEYTGSAVAVERCFSSGRNTISLRRSRLHADTIQSLMIYKSSLQLARRNGELPWMKNVDSDNFND